MDRVRDASDNPGVAVARASAAGCDAMAMDILLIAADSTVTAGVFGLAGSLVGGAVAGTVSFLVARQAREAAESSWLRDNRREIYSRFLTHAQQLLIACEDGMRAARSAAARDAVQPPYVSFFDTYGVIQTVAARPVVDTARVYAYRLLALREIVASRGVFGEDEFGRVASLVRTARHDAIDAMRADLGLAGSARPPQRYNPFIGTELAAEYDRRAFGAD